MIKVNQYFQRQGKTINDELCGYNVDFMVVVEDSEGLRQPHELHIQAGCQDSKTDKLYINGELFKTRR